MTLLALNDLNVFYGQVQVLRQVSLTVRAGEIIALVGANSSGKSTLIKTISGLIQPSAGSISFAGERMDRLRPHEIVERGIVQIPEGRRLFPFMSVEENLMVGAYNTRAKNNLDQTMAQVLDLFPVLRERRRQLGRTLSGGEQQMLAIARGLMARPKLLMFDEPSLGLAPILVRDIFKIIPQVRAQNIPVLLVEQNVKQSLGICDRGYVLENGRIVLEGAGPELLDNPNIKKAYLGL
ncbi:MAG: ABC transporter ATP-binding protein [Thermodesulfobacteriota bacterium]